MRHWNKTVGMSSWWHSVRPSSVAAMAQAQHTLAAAGTPEGNNGQSTQSTDCDCPSLPCSSLILPRQMLLIFSLNSLSMTKWQIIACDVCNLFVTVAQQNPQTLCQNQGLGRRKKLSGVSGLKHTDRTEHSIQNPDVFPSLLKTQKQNTIMISQD